MNIFIAKDYANKPLGLLLAESKEYAQVAFEAMGTQHHSIEEIDVSSTPGGVKVFYILTSTEENYGMNKEYRKWKRGK